MLDIVPSGSVENGYGNFGQLGTGNNATLGDEVGAVLVVGFLRVLRLPAALLFSCFISLRRHHCVRHFLDEDVRVD